MLNRFFFLPLGALWGQESLVFSGPQQEHSSAWQCSDRSTALKLPARGLLSHSCNTSTPWSGQMQPPAHFSKLPCTPPQKRGIADPWQCCGVCAARSHSAVVHVEILLQRGQKHLHWSTAAESTRQTLLKALHMLLI